MGGMAKPMLQVESVRKAYAGLNALSGVSLVVEPGEVFGLLGPNGAGKTTLLSIIAGLLEPDAGQVRLNDRLFGPGSREMRRLVGLGTQDLAVYPELTARENLVFFGKLYGMRDPDLATRVNQLLAAVGLTERADDRAGTFSGGMKRRLNLAVAVVHRPALLLLDEPTTGVDPQSRNHIFEMVRGLNREGMTIVYTSHYMEEVQALCRRIAILDNGQLKACNTLDELLNLLGTTVRMTVAGPSPDFAGQLGTVNGVKVVRPDLTGFVVAAGVGVAGVLPELARLCADTGTRLTSLSVAEPTLEKVFLHLTGRELRD
jgi:ABC-2 type transport system ATP-binding protein